MIRSPKTAHVLIGIFVLALLPRVAVLVLGPWHDMRRAMQPDSYRYVLLAENLKTYGRFAKMEEDGIDSRAIARLRLANGTLPRSDEYGLRPESFRTPGYPAFIAGVTALTQSLRAVLLVQCVLGALMAGAVFLIGRALGLPDRVSIAASVLWSVHPGLIVFDNLVMAESIFISCLMVALLVAARSASVRMMLMAGVLIGIATLVRPLGLLYIPAVIAMAWHRGVRRRVAFAALVLIAALPPAFWAGRNYAVGEGFRISPVAEHNLLISTAAYTISEARGEDWLKNWPARLDELFHRLGQRLGPGEDVYAAGRRLALDEIAAYPAALARVHAKSLVKLTLDHSAAEAWTIFGQPYESSGLFSRFVLRDSNAPRGSVSVVAVSVGVAWMALNALIVLGALCGLVIALYRRSWALVIACGMTVALFAAATGSVGLERFRLPVMLPLLILAGTAIAAIDPNQRNRVIARKPESLEQSEADVIATLDSQRA